jgi:hypothetical protein
MLMVRPSQRRATDKYKKKHYRTVIGYIKRDSDEFRWLDNRINNGISINSTINECLRLGMERAGWKARDKQGGENND